eukprot:911320-Prymnesium_polylepis.1
MGGGGSCPERRGMWGCAWSRTCWKGIAPGSGGGRASVSWENAWRGGRACVCCATVGGRGGRG